MGGIGVVEIATLALFFVLGYGLLMTVDAIRRPPERFRVGRKLAWVIALVILNPLVTKFISITLWFASLILFPAVAGAHHWLNRRRNPVRSPGGGGAEQDGATSG